MPIYDPYTSVLDTYERDILASVHTSIGKDPYSLADMARVMYTL
jgi:hypothetical protein